MIRGPTKHFLTEFKSKKVTISVDRQLVGNSARAAPASLNIT